MRQVNENVFAGIAGKFLPEIEEIVTSSSCHVNVKDVTVTHRLGSIVKKLLLYRKPFYPASVTFKECMGRVKKLWVRSNVSKARGSVLGCYDRTVQVPSSGHAGYGSHPSQSIQEV
jgi:hypothetical protein